MGLPNLPPEDARQHEWLEAFLRREELQEALSPLLQKPSAWQRWGRNALLFALTAVSVYMCGGLPLAIGLLSILFTHEMGHYVACRYHKVDATLPFFLPGLFVPIPHPWTWMPIPFVGTFGAVIRIKSPIPHRKALFDIGVAGPLAGFLVCLPVLVLGVLRGQWTHDVPGTEGLGLGEPLLFTWAVHLLKGAPPDGATFAVDSLGLAAWFGLFVTALNLMPVGQLDGGHVISALLPRHSHWISRAGLLACLGLLYLRPAWIVWTVLLWVLGRRPHPPTVYPSLPAGRGRVVVGFLAFVVFALCFTPSPVELSWAQLGGALLELARPVLHTLGLT